MGEVVGLTGGAPPERMTGEPRKILIDMLRDALAMAERGELQTFVGTGFCADGHRLAMWAPINGEDVYQMLGAIAWLEHEYVARITGGHS